MDQPGFYPKRMARQSASRFHCIDTATLQQQRSCPDRRPLACIVRPVHEGEDQAYPRLRSPEIENVPQLPHDAPFQTLTVSQPQSRHSSRSSSSRAFSGLPDHFVEALKQLFDMVDAERRGLVSVQDLTVRWNQGISAENEDPNLPKGIADSLRKVANAEGLLTFERFCAGLKIAMIRHEASKKKFGSVHTTSGENSLADSSLASESDSSDLGPKRSSAGVDSSSSSSAAADSADGQTNRVQGSPGNCSSFLGRTSSLPNLYKGIGGGRLEYGFSQDIDCDEDIRFNDVESQNVPGYNCSARDRLKNSHGLHHSPVPSEPGTRELFTGLENFAIRRHRSQIFISGNEPPKPPRDPNRKSGNFAYSVNSLPADIIPSQQALGIKYIWKEPPRPAANYQLFGQTAGRIPSQLQSRGPKVIDIQHLTREQMAQWGQSNPLTVEISNRLERERSLLEEGLRTLKSAQDWFEAKLQEVGIRSEKGSLFASTPNCDSPKGRLVAEETAIIETTNNLKRLIEISSKREFHGTRPREPILKLDAETVCQPLEREHKVVQGYNHADRSGSIERDHLILERQVQRLKEQNRLLTAEVGQKNSQLNALELEKRTLIKQLFQHSHQSNRNRAQISKQNDLQQQQQPHHHSYNKRQQQPNSIEDGGGSTIFYHGPNREEAPRKLAF